MSTPLHPGQLTDVAGLTVGHFTHSARPTGCTVVLCPQGAVCGVDQRGGAPGTRETDLLRSENMVQQVHALLLTGGSAFGLDAAGGVMRWLEEHGHGLPVGPACVPIVPAAVIFDLWRGDASIRPDAAAGYAACAVAGAQVLQGGVGAGAGATVGKLFGIDRAMTGGVGTASLTVSGVTVAALVVVNALGDVFDEQGQVLAGARASHGQGFAHTTEALLQGLGPPRWVSAPGTATTIGVVATNARLSKTEANRLAALAHHGLARAVNPLTQYDGDTLFALATATTDQTLELSALGALGAECVSRAVRNAVRGSQALG